MVAANYRTPKQRKGIRMIPQTYDRDMAYRFAPAEEFMASMTPLDANSSIYQFVHFLVMLGRSTYRLTPAETKRYAIEPFVHDMITGESMPYNPPYLGG